MTMHHRRAGARLLATTLACAAASAIAAAPTALPAPRAMADVGIAATIPVGKTADWVAITAREVWVGSTGPNAVSAIDPATNQVTRVELPGRPCAGLATDGAALFVPLCGPVPKLARVDLATRALAWVVDIGPPAGEGGIAVGAGSVWLVIDKAGTLARVDPATGAVTARATVPAGSYNPVFAGGRVWVSRVEGAAMTAVDPATMTAAPPIPVPEHPRFVTAGGGAVWSLNQGEGSLSRIDAAGRGPARTLPLGTPGPGGDVTYADGTVWTTMMGTPLTAVNARGNRVLCRWQGPGGDSLGVGHGAIWLTNLRAGTVSRIPLATLPRGCTAAR